MNILLLAPHPFYQERGTPIAVDLLLRVLSARGDRVEVVTFHEGADKTYRGVTIHRIPALPGIHNIPPGFSWKKIVCDLVFALKVLALKSRKKFDVVHAVEESVFIAMLIHCFWRTPYIFDMDSSMPMQMIEQKPALAALAPVLKFFEARAARNAFAVVAVCQALADIARAQGARRVFILHDISLLSSGYALAPGAETPGLNVRKPCLMYIGNLEAYQGIDLLLDSFAMLLTKIPQAYLAIIGGNDRSIGKYTRQSAALGIAPQVGFFGSHPLTNLARLFAQADILVSPRVKGVNTPMKIYSYLQSGKPILATNLPTHTQALDGATALLVNPTAEEFAGGMLRLLRDPVLGRQLAARAQARAEEQYSFKSYAKTLGEIYSRLETEIRAPLAAGQ